MTNAPAPAWRRDKPPHFHGSDRSLADLVKGMGGGA